MIAASQRRPEARTFQAYSKQNNRDKYCLYQYEQRSSNQRGSICSRVVVIAQASSRNATVPYE